MDLISIKLELYCTRTRIGGGGGGGHSLGIEIEERSDESSSSFQVWVEMDGGIKKGMENEQFPRKVEEEDRVNFCATPRKIN